MGHDYWHSHYADIRRMSLSAHCIGPLLPRYTHCCIVSTSCAYIQLAVELLWRGLLQEASDKAQEGGAEAEDGQPGSEQQPRKRGRPVGSRTKVRPEDQLGPADTPQEAMKRFFKSKAYSSKINYPVLDGMFDSSQVPRRYAWLHAILVSCNMHGSLPAT